MLVRTDGETLKVGGKMNVKVLIATHKEYKMTDYKYYLPIHVGKNNKKSIGYTGDNSGDNISYKNAHYCELTGLYWGWKNLECDYIGLVHYRRHFTNKKYLSIFTKDKSKYILSDLNIEKLLSGYDVILPKKRNYYIETLYSHYAHTHYAEHLDETRKIISEYYPKYLKSFDQVMKSTSGHMFNMFIMKKNLADEYCKWLFDILEKLEEKIDVSDYDSYQARLYGRVSELLLNVWILNNKIKYKEVPHMHMENINWINKGYSFLRAKFNKKKFEHSF